MKSEFQLEEQRLVHAEFKVSPTFQFDKEAIELDVKTETYVSKYDEGSDNHTIVRLVTTVFDNDLEKYPFYLKIVFEGLFEWENLENANEYLRINAPAVLFSYVRSVASNLTSFSDIPTLILPLMDFSTNKEGKN